MYDKLRVVSLLGGVMVVVICFVVRLRSTTVLGLVNDLEEILN